MVSIKYAAGSVKISNRVSVKPQKVNEEGGEIHATLFIITIIVIMRISDFIGFFKILKICFF